MTAFPRQMAGGQFYSLDHLTQWVEGRAASGAVDNPGQMYPADSFEALPNDDRALVAEACALLVRDSTDPNVLLCCAMCGKWSRAAFEAALLDRIEAGPPIPDAPGVSGMNLYERLTEAFAWGPMAPDHVARAREVLDAHAPPSSRVQFLAVHGSAIELATAIEEACEDDTVREDMVAYGVGRLAAKDPGQVMLVLPSLATLSKTTREGVLSHLRMFAGDWFATEGDRVRHGLGL